MGTVDNIRGQYKHIRLRTIHDALDPTSLTLYSSSNRNQNDAAVPATTAISSAGMGNLNSFAAFGLTNSFIMTMKIIITNDMTIVYGLDRGRLLMQSTTVCGKKILAIVRIQF